MGDTTKISKLQGGLVIIYNSTLMYVNRNWQHRYQWHWHIGRNKETYREEECKGTTIINKPEFRLLILSLKRLKLNALLDLCCL